MRTVLGALRYEVYSMIIRQVGRQFKGRLPNTIFYAGSMQYVMTILDSANVCYMKYDTTEINMNSGNKCVLLPNRYGLWYRVLYFLYSKCTALSAPWQDCISETPQPPARHIRLYDTFLAHASYFELSLK